MDSFKVAVDRVPMIRAAYRFTVPSKSEVAERYKDSTPSEIEDYYVQAVTEYETAMRHIYYAIYDSLDLHGPFKNIDRRYIQSQFRDDDGDTCDGKGLLAWVMGFGSKANITTQLKLQADLPTIKLSVNASLNDVQLHNNNVLDTWSSMCMLTKPA